MHLITMAHFGEAQGVIEKLKLKRIRPDFFQGDNTSLILTGEGPFEAATMTAKYAESLKASKVTNLGIAGSLSPELKIGEFLSVRSIYLVQNEKLTFKTIQANESGIDLITSFERILDPEKALPLKGFGKLVDREAWGAGFAAKKAGIPFGCFKLVSDAAGSLGACELVKEKAQELSNRLAEEFLKLSSYETSEETKNDIPGLYFTFSTQHLFNDYLNKLMIKNEMTRSDVLKICGLERILELEVSPKDKVKKLLIVMETKLDPTREKIAGVKNDLIKKFSEQGLKLEIDSQFENPKVKISFEAADDSELNDKREKLKKVSLDKFQQIMQGELDVE